MSPIIIIYSKLHVKGMALFPFMILREKSFTKDPVIMNHELIHHRQQLELLIVPFYVFYVLNYIINRFRYEGHYNAYRNIIFEREAYANESDPDYLKQRSWLRFLRYSGREIKG